jgi:hypothetical protein
MNTYRNATTGDDAAHERAPRRLRPHVVAVAGYLATPAPDAPPSLFKLLVEIDRRWPHLAFADFVSATVVADLLREPKGSA